MLRLVLVVGLVPEGHCCFLLQHSLSAARCAWYYGGVVADETVSEDVARVLDGALKRNTGAVIMGSMVPDMFNLLPCGDECKMPDGQPAHAELGENMHWPVYHTAAANYLRATWGHDITAWPEDGLRMFAFMVGSLSHYVHDGLWSGLFPGMFEAQVEAPLIM